MTYKKATSYNENMETYVFLSCHAEGTMQRQNRCAPHDAIEYSFVVGDDFVWFGL